MGNIVRLFNATWRRVIGYGLGRKLTIIACTLIVLFVNATLVVNYYTQAEMIEHRLQVRASDYSSMLTNVSANYLYNLNVADLEVILEDTFRKRYIGYVYVLDAAGLKVADGNYAENNDSFLLPKSDPIAEQAARSRSPVAVRSASMLDVGVPVMLDKKLLGTVRFGLLLDEFAAELALVQKRNLWIGSVFVLIGLMISAIASRHLTRSLKSLTAASEAAARGNLNQKIDVRTNDELETLARAFNHMLKSLQENVDQINFLAYHDQLTGLANRACCQQDLEERFSNPKASRRLAFVQIDLDNFKRVNDRLGHAAGDHLLKVLGERFRLVAQECCNFKPYRWGGDEFIAIVDRDEHFNIDAFCRRLTETISVPVQFDNKVLNPTISIGVARYPEDAETLSELMIFSDLALYKTKELGRDGYQFFSSSMKEKVYREAQIETELRVAIEKKQLELYYQPQVDIVTGHITGLEALIRWIHPDKGVISPAEFLLIAENTGLGPEIGRFVFDEAMAAAKDWSNSDIRFGRLAMNLSPRHLMSDHFLEDFFAAMATHEVDPQLLSVEILESYIIDDPHSDISDMMKTLRNSSVGVELDDFGTGYASLAHLSTLPVTGLKIDQSFIHQMTHDEKQSGIVSALISMTRLMDLHIVCEGVETQDQIAMLQEFENCAIQGFFIAKPMPRASITKWIAEWTGNNTVTSMTRERLTKKVG